MAGVRIISETIEKDVTFLANADIQFVSLVRHGANQMPFRVIKNEKGGGDNVRTIVQSIMLPKNMDLLELAGEEGLQWLSEAKKENWQEFAEYKKMEQIPVEKFVKDSLTMVKLHQKGAWALVGKIEGEVPKEALALGTEEVKKLMGLAESPMNAPVASAPREDYVISFGEMFEKELMNFIDIVKGSMDQVGSTPQQRKSNIFNALDAFKGFLAMGLDAAQSSDTGKEDKSQEFIKGEFEKIHNSLKQAFEGGQKDMFKDKEEFTQAVKELFVSFLDERDANAKASAPEPIQDPAVEVKAAPEGADQIAAILTKMGEMQEIVNGLALKTEKFGDQLSTIPAGQQLTDPKPEKRSVFAGLLTSNQ